MCWVVADKLGFQLEFIYVHNWTEIHKIHARKFNLYKKISKTSFHAWDFFSNTALAAHTVSKWVFIWIVRIDAMPTKTLQLTYVCQGWGFPRVYTSSYDRNFGLTLPLQKLGADKLPPICRNLPCTVAHVWWLILVMWVI